jgi:TonB-linked SusC/RagA family outer membrane protein
VGTSTQIDIDLVPDLMELDEVIVVGYGTQKRSDITGAVAQMEGDGLAERPITRVDQALVGQMAGVRIKQTSGMPGKGMQIQVRGTGSITANTEPLYVIDGFPLEASKQNTSGSYEAGNPLDNINPNDIESIQVLKDASATAIYGSRGSNGVVLIQTKSGKTGKANITFNAYTGFNEPTRHCDMLSAEEWIERATEIINHNYISADPGDENRQATDDYDTRMANIGSFERSMIPDPRWTQDGYPGLTFIDWQDEIFRKGKVQNYQLSASGGTENAKYYISGDYFDQDGFIRGVNYKRYSARTNIELKKGKWLTFGGKIAPSYSINQDPGAEGKDGLMHKATGMVPISEDSVGIAVNTGEFLPYTWGGSSNSPVYVLENTIGETRIFRTLSSVYAEAQIFKDLTFKTTVNLDYTDSKRKYYKPAFVSGKKPSTRTASGSYSGYTRKTFVNENYFNYNKTFGDHVISGVAGFSYHLNTLATFKIAGTGGFGSDYITTLNDAVEIKSSSTYTQENENVLLSYFGRLNYSFGEKYLLGATVRRDGSSRFGAKTKWGIFPSFSAGWKISRESFMQDISTISNLKFRASWGLSGNESFSADDHGGNYEHIPLLQSSNYSFNGQSVTGYSSKNLANTALSWEESKTINIGLDYGILNNRIQGAFDYYIKTNTDLLLEIDVPAATGFTEALTNIGEVKNQGWEIELTTFNLTGDFNWSTNINLSHNENEVLHLGPNDSPMYYGIFSGGHRILQVGDPIYSIYVVQQDGILSQSDIDNGAALYGNQTEGDAKYVDQITVDTDGDGIADAADGQISADDRVIVGQPDPSIIWSISNTFKYKGFDLSILVQGQNGGYIYSLFGRAVDRTSMGWLDPAIGAHRDRWRSPENPGAGERGKATGSFGYILNTDWLYSSDYWRVRNITLGYDLGRLIKTEHINGARIYVTAENFFGADKYYGGYNPEAVNSQGDDYGGAPLPKSLIFGVNLKF